MFFKGTLEERSKPKETRQISEDKFVVTTNYDYDMEKIKDIAKAFFLPAIVMMFTHFRYGYVQPLVFQAILPWRQYWGMPIVRVHFLGAKAEGENKRPWKGGIDAMWVVVLVSGGRDRGRSLIMFSIFPGSAWCSPRR